MIYTPMTKGDHPRICTALAVAYIRIADMRATVGLELDRIDEFNARAGADLKTHFGRVSGDFMCVLRQLGPGTIGAIQTPRQMVEWLDNVEALLRRTIQQRKAFEAAHVRVADMRGAVRLERERMEALNDRISPDLRGSFESVSDDLRTVLRWLEPLTLGEAHTSHEMAKWLDCVQGIFQSTRQRRVAIEAFLKEVRK
jgi:hypothetical protein